MCEVGGQTSTSVCLCLTWLSGQAQRPSPCLQEPFSFRNWELAMASLALHRSPLSVVELQTALLSSCLSVSSECRAASVIRLDPAPGSRNPGHWTVDTRSSEGFLSSFSSCSWSTGVSQPRALQTQAFPCPTEVGFGVETTHVTTALILANDLTFLN